MALRTCVRNEAQESHAAQRKSPHTLHRTRCCETLSTPLPLQVLGTDDFYEYLGKYGLQLDPQLENLVGSHTKKPWAKFINADNEHLVSEEAIDFLDHILCYDHQHRLTCQEAMAHQYFDPVRPCPPRLHACVRAGRCGRAGAVWTVLTCALSQCNTPPMRCDDVMRALR